MVVLCPNFFHVLFDEIGNPFDQGVTETFFGIGLAPGRLGGFVSRGAVLERVGKFDQPLRGVAAAIEEHVFHPFEQLGLDLFVDFQLSGVDDGHVQARLDSVIQKRRVDRLANRLIPPKGERHVAYPAGDTHVGIRPLNLSGGLDEIHGVPVVILQAGSDSQHVGIKDDVGRRHADLSGKQVEGPLGDPQLVLHGDGLSFFVEHHHHAGGAVPLYEPGPLEKQLLPVLQADRIDDPLSLDALQTGLDNRPGGTVDHHRDPGHVGFGRQQIEESRHHGRAVQQGVVHVDVDHVGPALHLPPGNRNGLTQFLFSNQSGELSRTGYVGSLADHGEAHLRAQDQGFQPAIARAGVGLRRTPGGELLDGLGNRPNVLRRGSATAAHDVQPSGLGKLSEHFGHLFGRLVVLAELIG